MLVECVALLFSFGNGGKVTMEKFLLLLQRLHWRLQRWVRRFPVPESGFPIGPSGPVPLSSEAMNSQLIRAARRQSRDRTQRRELESILDLVGNAAYTQALRRIADMLGIQPARDVEILGP